MAALPNWVQFAARPSLLLTWYREDTTDAEDLTGATLTGKISDGITTRAITGALGLTDADGGVFRWDLSGADVADHGRLEVQFTATFVSGQSPAKTFKCTWYVEKALV